MLKGLLKIFIAIFIIFAVTVLWDSYKNRISRTFCGNIKITDNLSQVLRKAKINGFKFINKEDEVWVYTQPTAQGLYQEGIACVVTFKNSKIIEKDIRVY